MAASRNASAVPAGPRRVSFARIQEPLEVPDLLALQTESFDWLLGNDRWKGRVEAARQAGRKNVPAQSGTLPFCLIEEPDPPIGAKRTAGAAVGAPTSWRPVSW